MRVGRSEMEQDLYAVLGVPSWSSDADLRRAHRRLARKHHPDLRGGHEPSDQRMKQVNLAASILLDASARARYDALRRQGPQRWREAPPSTAPRSTPRPRRGAHGGAGTTAGPSFGRLDLASSRLFVIALAMTALVACLAQLHRTHVPVASSDYRIPSAPQMLTAWSDGAR